MGKRLLTALAVLLLMAGFVTACGDDDDDVAASDDDTEETADEPTDDMAADDPMITVCSDTGQADDGIITPEEAGEGAAQFEAVTDPPEEIADAIAGSADYLRQLEAAGEDVSAEDTLLSEHLQAVASWCAENMG